MMLKKNKIVLASDSNVPKKSRKSIKETISNEERNEETVIRKKLKKHVNITNLDEQISNEERVIRKKLKKHVNIRNLDEQNKQNNGEVKQSNRKAKKFEKQNREQQESLNLLAVDTVKGTKQRKRKLSESKMLDSDDSDSEQVIVKKKTVIESAEEKEPETQEMKERTIFVGNIPLKCTKKQIKTHFGKYGIIDSIRIRGIPVANPKLPKKIAIIKQEFHPDRNNCICYIRYKNKQDALKAEALNGSLFEGHHLRVHYSSFADKPDESKAIFIGNLSFDAAEDELWKLFEVCGPISHVRIVRDTYTGMGKGFAYVNFKDNDAVQLALEMEDVKLRERVLRISLCNSSIARRNKKMKKIKEIKKPGQPKFRRPFNRNKSSNSDAQESQQFEINRKKVTTPLTGRKSFQGSKFNDKKKKFKKNKGLTEKKRKIDIIAPKDE